MIQSNLTLNAKTLSGIHAFQQLTIQQRQDVAKKCHIRLYQSGQEIVSCNDMSRDIYFIISGNAQATVFSQSGKQITLSDLSAGDMFGELSAIDGRPRSAHVLAQTDTVMCRMSPEDFEDVFRHYPDVAKATLQRLTGLVRHLCERVFEISTLPVKQRIQAELLRLALQNLNTANEAVIKPAPTHQDIANHVCTQREGVTKELNELKKMGVIEANRKALIIRDVALLRTMVQSHFNN